jgi:hypothetical protein
VLTGVTPGGEYKVARPEGPRYGQAGPGWYRSDNYYAQPRRGVAFSGARLAVPITMDLRGCPYRKSNPLQGSDPLFSDRRKHIVALTIRHKIPTMFFERESVIDGGLNCFSVHRLCL